MNIRIGEQWDELLEDVLNYLECSVHCYIKATSETGWGCAGNIFINLSPSPRSSVIGSCDLGNNSHSSHHRVSYDFLNVLDCVDLNFVDPSVLRHLWMALQHNWEVVFVDHVPV